MQECAIFLCAVRLFCCETSLPWVFFAVRLLCCEMMWVFFLWYWPHCETSLLWNSVPRNTTRLLNFFWHCRQSYRPHSAYPWKSGANLHQGRYMHHAIPTFLPMCVMAALRRRRFKGGEISWSVIRSCSSCRKHSCSPKVLRGLSCISASVYWWCRSLKHLGYLQLQTWRLAPGKGYQRQI